MRDLASLWSCRRGRPTRISVNLDTTVSDLSGLRGVIRAVVLEPEVAIDIASDGAVGAHNVLDLVLDEEVVRIDVPIVRVSRASRSATGDAPSGRARTV